MRGLSSFSILCCTLILGSCDKDKPSDKDTFNRTAMLEWYADGLIFPSYTELGNRLNALESAAQDFTSQSDSIHLISLQEEWKLTSLSWKKACAFNVGPAAEAGLTKSLQEEIATFPVSEAKVANILSSGTFNLNDFNRDARGFFTLEYLIFNRNNNLEILLTSFDNQVRKDFLLALCADLKQRVETVKQAWSSSYRNEFIQSSGTDVGSSTSQLYNEFVKSYEGLKNFSLGLPLGLRAGQTSVQPELLEAYYSGFSLPLARAHFDAMEVIWRGGADEKGFKSYLQSVTGGPELITTTESQLAIIKSKFDALPANQRMEDQILTNPNDLIALHTELQKNTKNFKSDLSSLIGIAITYASSDGD